MRIDRMLFANFAPFAAGGIVFPEVPDRSGAEVHLLVGENGTGKTRLLCLLLRALGNDTELKARVDDPAALRTLVSAEVGNMFGFHSGGGAFIAKQLPSWHNLLQFAGVAEDVLPQSLIGRFPPQPRLVFVSGAAPEFQVSSLLENPGGSLAEKSVAVSYKGTASISDAEVSSMKAVPAGPLAGDLVFQKDPNESEVIGQLMVNLKLASAMDLLQGDTSGRNIRLVDRLERTLSEITGRRFSFRVIASPKVELRVDWGAKRSMRISQLPDGMCSIIGWLVSCSARLCMHLPDEPAPSIIRSSWSSTNRKATSIPPGRGGFCRLRRPSSRTPRLSRPLIHPGSYLR